MFNNITVWFFFAQIMSRMGWREWVSKSLEKQNVQCHYFWKLTHTCACGTWKTFVFTFCYSKTGKKRTRIHGTYLHSPWWRCVPQFLAWTIKRETPRWWIPWSALEPNPNFTFNIISSLEHLWASPKRSLQVCRCTRRSFENWVKCTHTIVGIVRTF